MATASAPIPQLDSSIPPNVLTYPSNKVTVKAKRKARIFKPPVATYSPATPDMEIAISTSSQNDMLLGSSSYLMFDVTLDSSSASSSESGNYMALPSWAFIDQWRTSFAGQNLEDISNFRFLCHILVNAQSSPEVFNSKLAVMMNAPIKVMREMTNYENVPYNATSNASASDAYEGTSLGTVTQSILGITGPTYQRPIALTSVYRPCCSISGAGVVSNNTTMSYILPMFGLLAGEKSLPLGLLRDSPRLHVRWLSTGTQAFIAENANMTGHSYTVSNVQLVADINSIDPSSAYFASLLDVIQRDGKINLYTSTWGSNSTTIADATDVTLPLNIAQCDCQTLLCAIRNTAALTATSADPFTFTRSNITQWQFSINGEMYPNAPVDADGPQCYVETMKALGELHTDNGNCLVSSNYGVQGLNGGDYSTGSWCFGYALDSYGEDGLLRSGEEMSEVQVQLRRSTAPGAVHNLYLFYRYNVRMEVTSTGELRVLKHV